MPGGALALVDSWAASDVYTHSDFAELFMVLYQQLVVP
jgi:hypothetical protein